MKYISILIIGFAVFLNIQGCNDSKNTEKVDPIENSQLNSGANHPEKDDIQVRKNMPRDDAQEEIPFDKLIQNWPKISKGESIVVRGRIKEINPNVISFENQKRFVMITLFEQSPTDDESAIRFHLSDVKQAAGLSLEQDVVIRGIAHPLNSTGTVRECQILSSGQQVKHVPPPLKLLTDVEVKNFQEKYRSLSKIEGFSNSLSDNSIRIASSALDENGALAPNVAEQLSKNYWIEGARLQCRVSTGLIEQIAQIPNLKMLEIGKSSEFSDEDSSLEDVSFEPLVEHPHLLNFVIRKCLGLGPEHFQQIGKFQSLRRLEIVALFGDELVFGNNSIQPLGNLQSLRWLKLPEPNLGIEVEFNDEGLAHLGKCSRLSTATLSSTSITGAGFEALADCPELHGIEIRSSPVTAEGLVALESLRHLESLKLFECQELSDQLGKTVHNISTLKELDLSSTNIGNQFFSNFSKHLNLQSINVSNTKITDEGLIFLEHEDWPNLLEFRIAGNSGIGMKAVDRLHTNIGSIELYDFSDTGVNDLAASMFVNLNPRPVRSLDFTNCPITDLTLKRFAAGHEHIKIESLLISGTKVTDEGVRKLSEIQSLRTLSLPDTISSNSISNLKKLNPELTIY